MKKILIFSLLIITLAVGAVALPAGAADHLDAPGLTSPGGDGRLDINDIYAFQSPENPDNVVLIMTVNPAAGALSPTTFHNNAFYQFLVDYDNDSNDRDAAITFRFSRPDDNDQQQVTITAEGNKGPDLLASGMTNEVITLNSGLGSPIRAFAGTFDDPFFFDLHAFLGTDGRTFCDGAQNDFFVGLNVSAIVLEGPRDLFRNDNIGVWARTMLNGEQVDRMGRPAINTVFIPSNPFEPAEASQKNAFNAGRPRKDQAQFRAEIVDTLALFYPAGDPTIDALADILLPDLLTIDTSSAAGFHNGRQLADDVIDAELALVTNGAVPSDCVDANDQPFSNTFPYLASAN